MMTHDKLVKILVADIQNRTDGAGSDLEYVGEELYDGTWLEVVGALDIHALASTLMHELYDAEDN